MTWREFQRLQRVAEVDDTFISYVDDGVGELSEPRHEPEVRRSLPSARQALSGARTDGGRDGGSQECMRRFTLCVTRNQTMYGTSDALVG